MRLGRPLFPPANVEFFTPGDGPREDFYLVVSALTPYKKVDHAVEACRLAGRPLVVIGSGPEAARLRSSALGLRSSVRFLGWQSDEVVRDHYRRCRAVLFPQFEDAGIVPLEAFACGAPVIAFGEGGALDTVRDAADGSVADPTGLLYRPQTPQALAAAIEQFESSQVQSRLDAGRLRDWAEQFSTNRFVEKFKGIVGPLLGERGFAGL